MAFRPAGYAARPHTGLASLIAKLGTEPRKRYLLLTRDVLLASGQCSTVHLERDDVDVRPMPRTRQETLELLRSRQHADKPLMVVCRLSSSVSFFSDDVECTARTIHQLRRLADEQDTPVIVTVLLPPKTLHESRSYVASFLGNWQVYHMDCLDDAESPALVASILSPSLHAQQERAVSENELHKDLWEDLWACVARLSVSEPMRLAAEGWTHEASGFYSGEALQTRVDLLWKYLTDAKLEKHRWIRKVEESR